MEDPCPNLEKDEDDNYLDQITMMPIPSNRLIKITYPNNKSFCYDALVLIEWYAKENEHTSGFWHPVKDPLGTGYIIPETEMDRAYGIARDSFEQVFQIQVSLEDKSEPFNLPNFAISRDSIKCLIMMFITCDIKGVAFRVIPNASDETIKVLYPEGYGGTFVYREEANIIFDLLAMNYTEEVEYLLKNGWTINSNDVENALLFPYDLYKNGVGDTYFRIIEPDSKISLETLDYIKSKDKTLLINPILLEFAIRNQRWDIFDYLLQEGNIPSIEVMDLILNDTSDEAKKRLKKLIKNKHYPSSKSIAEFAKKDIKIIQELVTFKMPKKILLDVAHLMMDWVDLDQYKLLTSILDATIDIDLNVDNPNLINIVDYLLDEKQIDYNFDIMEYLIEKGTPDMIHKAAKNGVKFRTEDANRAVLFDKLDNLKVLYFHGIKPDQEGAEEAVSKGISQNMIDYLDLIGFPTVAEDESEEELDNSGDNSDSD